MLMSVSATHRYHTNVTMNVRRAEVVRKQRAAADAREEAEEEAKVQAQLDALAEANGGFMQEIKRAVILQVCPWIDWLAG